MDILAIQQRHAELRDQILSRLAEFAAQPRDSWFYEIAYCLLTPQSKAIHAHAAIEALKQLDFQHQGGNPTPILVSPHSYIRFHNVKSRRLHTLREIWPEVELALGSDGLRTGDSAKATRDKLVSLVPGMGYKESSHALRNLGWRGLGILDRHILRCLVALGVISESQGITTPKSYKYVEDEFERLALSISIDLDELDLVLWSMHTGFIFK